MRVLVVNAGSSSLKLRLLDADDGVEQSADLPAGPGGLDTSHLAEVMNGWARPDVVGHRVVHGGTRFTGPVLVDRSVRAALEELTDLAPLHQPKSLAALDAVTEHLPDVPAVASFDTAFHATIPAAAATYAVPAEWRERYGIRRYGFHGLSHAYCSARAAEMLGDGVRERRGIGPAGRADRSAGPRLDSEGDQTVGRPVAAGLRVITCHLGAGASLAAVLDGRSVDTTMGFTPLEGLVMATRSGTVDPGLVLWLEEHEHLTPHEVAVALEERSGLMALAGTGDMREIEDAVGRGDQEATLAIDVYVHRLVGGIASMSAATGGIDALVFTGGVGEHSPLVRRRAAERLGFLGVRVDEQLNDGLPRGADDADISAVGATVRTLVITAREDLQIAREARRAIES